MVASSYLANSQMSEEEEIWKRKISIAVIHNTSYLIDSRESYMLSSKPACCTGDYILHNRKHLTDSFLLLAIPGLQKTQMLVGEVGALHHIQSRILDPVLKLGLCCTKVPIETAKLIIYINFCRLIICQFILSVFSVALSKRLIFKGILVPRPTKTLKPHRFSGCLMIRLGAYVLKLIAIYNYIQQEIQKL